jgi:hypothetical protein
MLSSAMVLLVVVAVGLTLAFMTAKTNPVTNNFTPGVANIVVSEPNGSSYPISSDHSVNKIVAITNPSSQVGGKNPIPVYVRVRLVPVMRYASGGGTELAVGTGEHVNVSYSCSATPKISNDAWTDVQPDGYYYYKRVLQPGETTANLIDKAIVNGGISSNKNLEIQVIADSVQVEGNAEQDAWHMKYNNGDWNHIS